MRLTAWLILLSAATFSQTRIPPAQIRAGADLGPVVCFPATATTPAECLAVQFDPSIEVDRSYTPPLMKSVITSQSTPRYVGGPTGAVVVSNDKNPPEIDVATDVVPTKGQSQTITGLWSFAPGVLLPPMPLPACDAVSKWRLANDVVDSTPKFCDGSAWQPILAARPQQFREITAILTAPQSVFPVPDPAIVLGSLEVYRNGLLMSLGPDYTRGGIGAVAPVVFTAAQAPQAGDIVKLRYTTSSQ